jgi:hypothetical protein
MQAVDWLGFVGVFQILLAYFLNVTGKVTNNSLVFILLNLIGATMACIASLLLDYLPFIILEGIWALIALYSLIQYKKAKL